MTDRPASHIVDALLSDSVDARLDASNHAKHLVIDLVNALEAAMARSDVDCALQVDSIAEVVVMVKQSAVRLFESDRRRVTLYSAKLLAEFGDERGVPVLLDELNAASELSLEAAWQLAHQGVVEALDGIESLIMTVDPSDSTEHGTVSMLTDAMRRLNNGEVTSKVRQHLSSAEPMWLRESWFGEDPTSSAADS